jgi:DNA-binding LytR/AlgR family response regulator
MLFVASTLAYNLHAKTLRQKMEAEKAKIRQENTSENSQLVSPAKNSIQRISVKTGQKIAVVQIEDILYFEADKDYVLIFTPQGKHLKEMTMKYLEENLPSNLFLRIHRSFIVNVEAISRIELYEKQSYIVIMKNGARLKMTQTGYRLLREKLQLG